MNHKRVFSLFVLLMLLLPSIVTISQNFPTQASGEITNSKVNDAYQDLASRATHIVVGEVKGVESRWDETKGVIYSHIKILVENHLKGNYDSHEIIVKQKGGEVGDIGLWSSAEPRFGKGERVKVFLKQLPELNEFAVVGGQQGKMSLSASASAGYVYEDFHWDASDLPVQYYINENGTPDIAGTAEEFAAVQRSFQTWEDDAGSYMDYTYLGTTTRSGLSQDGFNVVSWQSIDGEGGTLGETNYWYDPANKQLIEFDIVFDEDETWSVLGEADKHDIQNVGTHEVGHTLVLGDLYDAQDNDETMYGYSYLGETKKRDLYTGDIAGIRFIYGIESITYTIDTNPSGLQIEVDGANYTTPHSFSWLSGSEHAVNAVSPQNVDSGMRYVFEKWSDNGAQSHTVRVGTTGASLIADYTLQYQVSIRFKTDDNAYEIYPTRVRILGGSPNSTLITLSSYSNIWLDDVQWTFMETLWQGNNVVPYNRPTTYLSANFQWNVKGGVYPVWFNESFKDSYGWTLPIPPSGFRLKFPNDTISEVLNPSKMYYIQNGTTMWNSIMWQNTEVAPTNTFFDSVDGNPTVNCLIYDFTVRVTDLFGLPVFGASVIVTLPNGTTVATSTGIDGSAIFTTVPQGRFAADVSYLGQTTTIKGEVAETAQNSAQAQIIFSIPIILLMLVPVFLACFLIIVAMRRSLKTSQS